MLHKAAFFRALAIPACLVWGVLEFFALQRSRLLGRRTNAKSEAHSVLLG
ncbi:hypothetical protein [Rhodoferax ferrireducens]|nr:hypothetical protein [Rhodoferax ferrireducens]